MFSSVVNNYKALFTILNTKQVVSGILNLCKLLYNLDIANKEPY